MADIYCDSGAACSICKVCQEGHSTLDCPSIKSLEASGFFADDGDHEPLTEDELRECGVPNLVFL
ncbi:MAG: hypothetical protein AB203_00200 [Parcubacteria bacterium C7867-008]|nr:MAG: hypothetical protein AB203_00200 [Parcubacteria bacterium C7867-008]